ncbi:interferon alpha-inducible protein 27-like protein 2B [Ixodes scapularis]|uniref:interferon alpha-inducible protein 27-like protein 2B n=1 Tax=Ixodes scapularis TaxID=6945 RepID=UPI001A9EE14D|nr:interferon alpha-inducible protein 27-like protein 2B [Ixodes scapularis]
MDAEDAMKLGAVAVGVVGGVLAAPAVLSAAGFGAAGVAAGSVAAWAQSFMGGVVVKGGAFATLQSWGAAGIPIAAKAAVATVAGAVAGYAADSDSCADNYSDNC